MTTERARLLDEDGAGGEDGNLAWQDKETERVKGRVSGEHREERVSYTAKTADYLYCKQDRGKS